MTGPDVCIATVGERAGWLAARRIRLVAFATRWTGDEGEARKLADRELAPFAPAAPASAASEVLTVVEAGRPRGHVGVTVAGGPDRGRVEEVWIAPGHRRRGLGAAGLRAGLAWLAAHGARRVVTTVDGRLPASAALRAGWTVLSQRMVLDLADGHPPAPPQGFVARAMTRAEFAPWRDAAVDGYAESIVASGTLAPAAARRKSEDDFAALLPAGVATPNHSLHVIEADGRAVGTLWLAHHQPGRRTFVYDIEVREAERGRGYGRATMLAAARLADSAGDGAVGLNVFGHNTAALRLYDSLGYEVADQTWGMPLAAAGQGS
jgi:ribosomal protein S18 acetylase RimI-like enzyme